MKKQFLFILLALILIASPTVNGDAKVEHQYVSWQGSEADKAASIWLIKRSIDQQAEFIFQPYNSIITAGFAFDVPLSKFSRSHKQSTFDTLLSEYHLSDPTLDRMAHIIREIEINSWRPKVLKESILIDSQWLKIQKRYEKKTPPLTCILGFFDHFHKQLKQTDEPFFIDDELVSKLCLKDL